MKAPAKLKSVFPESLARQCEAFFFPAQRKGYPLFIAGLLLSDSWEGWGWIWASIQSMTA